MLALLRIFTIRVVINASFKESVKLYAEFSDTNPAWAKLYVDDAKFWGDQSLWFRFTFTEATFDRFM